MVVGFHTTSACKLVNIICNTFSCLFKMVNLFHWDTHAYTHIIKELQYLSFGLKHESQVVEDIKTEEEQEQDQNCQSSRKAGGSKPWCISPFLPLALPLSSDATWSLAQVTALFNDAICLMPSCSCQSILHYPSSCLPYSITRAPRLQCTKALRLKHRCGGPIKEHPPD